MTAEQRIGANITHARKAAGLSQEELSFAAEIHKTQISLFEGGHRMPRLLTLFKLAGGLGVLPGDLLAGVEWKTGVISYGQIVVEEA